MSRGKIYTRKGDKGTTGLIGGKRVEKDNPRIEAYGTLDELCASLGILRSSPLDDISKQNIFRIQKFLFIIGASLASETSENTQSNLQNYETETGFLETEIDRMEKLLPKLNNFLIPGDNPIEAQCNMARTICRRAERRICAVVSENSIEKPIIAYINRLSDFLFVLGRFLSNIENKFNN